MKSILTFAACGLAVGLMTPPAGAQQQPAHNAQMVQTETPYLGINALDITSERAKALKLKGERGVEITSVDADSAAAKAGLKEGDVILEFNGQRVEGWEQLRRLVSETPVHREVKVVISRNGAMQTLTATMGSHSGNVRALVFPTLPEGQSLKWEVPMPPSPPMIEMPQLRTFTQNRTIGIFGEPLGQEDQLAEFFGVKAGVLIRSVVKGSAAEKAGIKAGDVLVKIDEKSVSAPGDIGAILRAGGAKRTFTVTVVRNHKEVPLSLTLDNAVSMRGGLFPYDYDSYWTTYNYNPNDYFQLQFPSGNPVIESPKKGVTKFFWQ